MEYLSTILRYFTAVDWGEIADYNYFTASGQSRHVGRNLAMVIDHMVTQRNAKLGDIHVIGHSLGAHVAGFAGMYLQKERRKKIVRISGLGMNNIFELTQNACLFLRSRTSNVRKLK